MSWQHDAARHRYTTLDRRIAKRECGVYYLASTQAIPGDLLSLLKSASCGNNNPSHDDTNALRDMLWPSFQQYTTSLHSVEVRLTEERMCAFILFVLDFYYF